MAITKPTKPLTSAELKHWRKKNKIRRNFEVGDSNSIQKMLKQGTALSRYVKGGKVVKKKGKKVVKKRKTYKKK